jgi:hypothetical protein
VKLFTLHLAKIFANVRDQKVQSLGDSVADASGFELERAVVRDNFEDSSLFVSCFSESILAESRELVKNFFQLFFQLRNLLLTLTAR